jgi:hypothetical protein
MNKNRNIGEVFKMIEIFLMKECEKNIKIDIRIKLLNEESIEYLIKFILYCCLHSKKKDLYISRIFKL